MIKGRYYIFFILVTIFITLLGVRKHIYANVDNKLLNFDQNRSENNQVINVTDTSNRLIVKFKSGITPAVTNSGQLVTGRITIDKIFADQTVLTLNELFPSLDDIYGNELDQIYLIIIKDKNSVSEIINILTTNENVEWCESDYLSQIIDNSLVKLTIPSDLKSLLQGILIIPNDPLYMEQWGLEKINAPAAWNVITGTQTVSIAIVDSGIDLNHIDLINKIWVNQGEIPNNGIDDDNNGYIDDQNGWNFVDGNNIPMDDYGHGTQVAGIMAASTNNSLGIAGLCWNCVIMPIKVIRSNGMANYSDIASGVIYAAQKGAKIINLSLGGYSDSQLLHTAIQSAVNTYHSVVVAGVGNDNTNALFYPAAYPEVIAVAGTDENDKKSSISNYGTWVSVAAPSTVITTTLLGGDYGSVDGTSFAASLVSGLAGLIRSQNPEWEPNMVRGQIINTNDVIDNINPGFVGQIGSGRINANNAVTNEPHPILEIVSTSINGDPQGKATPGESSRLSIILQNSWLDANNTTATLYTSDPLTTIDQNATKFNNIPTNTTSTSNPDLIFSVSSGAGYNHPIQFTLTITANNGVYTEDFSFTIYTRSSEESVSGTIWQNTTWTSDKTYIVTNNIGVAPGITLTIQPGTNILFTGFFTINIGGTFIADGTEEKPIRFMSNNNQNWNNLYFDDSSVDAKADADGNYLGGNILRHTQVLSATNGIGCNNATPYIAWNTIDQGGINCLPGNTQLWIQDNVVNGNVGGGNGTQIINNIIQGNISTGNNTIIDNNNVHGGIYGGSNSNVKNNTCSSNANSIQINSGIVQNNQVNGGKIVSFSSSSILDNTIYHGMICVSTNSEIQGNNFEMAYPPPITGQVLYKNDFSLNVNCASWGGNNYSIMAGPGSTIKNNRIYNARGIYIEGGGIVEGNLIANANGKGVTIDNFGATSIISNTIIASSGNAITAYNSNSLTINGNNFAYNNGSYDIENLIDYTNLGTIPSENNWWETTDISIISQRIFDFFDDYHKGQVIFQPIANNPIQSAPAYVRNVTVLPDKTLGIQTGTFLVEFSRNMDINVVPELSFDNNSIVDNQLWITNNKFQTTYDITALNPRGVYTITVQEAIGADGIEIAPNSFYTLTVDYAGGVGDSTPPPVPVAIACAGQTMDTLSAEWTARDPDSNITMYSYAIGTEKGGTDVVYWTNTNETMYTWDGLSLIPGQYYYVSVKARNSGGLWSPPAEPNGVLPGSDICTTNQQTIYFVLILKK